MKPYIKITKTYIKHAFLLIDLFDPETSEQIQVSYDHILHQKNGKYIPFICCLIKACPTSINNESEGSRR